MCTLIVSMVALVVTLSYTYSKGQTPLNIKTAGKIYRSSLKGLKSRKNICKKKSQPFIPTFRKYGMLGRGTWCQDCLHNTFFYWCVVSLKDAHTPYARISNLLRCHGFLVVPASDGFQHLYLMSSDLGAILVVILALARGGALY